MNKFEDARSTGQKEENTMGKYEQDARLLLEYVGGKENIAAVSHCVSRMRFVLNDPAKADVAKIEALKSAKGTFTQAGQFQVIIGNTVNDFYNDFIAVSGIDGVSKEAVKSAAKQNQNALQKVMSVLAEIFAPLIPAIITGGLILGFRNCIDSIYFFNNGTQTLCDISQFWSGVDSFLWLIGEAVFHMLPVCICWSVTKKMGTTQSLGIVLGLTLVSGQLLNAYAVASTAAADIPKWDFGFFTINMIGYQAQVIPAMLAAFTLVYLEKFFRKICPPVISMIVVPFCSLVLSVIVAHTILGPIGWKIGSVISDVVYAGISGSFRVIFGAIFGFVYAPLVITGLHHMSNAIDMQLIADFGGTMLWPMIALSNIAQGSAKPHPGSRRKGDQDSLPSPGSPPAVRRLPHDPYADTSRTGCRSRRSHPADNSVTEIRMRYEGGYRAKQPARDPHRRTPTEKKDPRRYGKRQTPQIPRKPHLRLLRTTRIRRSIPPRPPSERTLARGVFPQRPSDRPRTGVRQGRIHRGAGRTRPLAQLPGHRHQGGPHVARRQNGH